MQIEDAIITSPACFPCMHPPLQERDHTSELGTLIPQSTCKLGRKFENSPRSESNAAKFLGDEHIGGQPLTTLWTAKERLCQNFFLKLAAAFVLNNLSQSASKGSLIGESFYSRIKCTFEKPFLTCFHVDTSKVFSRNTFNGKQAQRKSIKNKVLSDSFPRRKTWEKLELFSTHQVLTKLSENSLRLLKTVFSKKPIQIQNFKKSPSVYRDAGYTVHIVKTWPQKWITQKIDFF